MPRLDRRAVIGGGLAALGATAFGALASAKTNLRLYPDETLNEVPANYNGFSVETSQLSDPAYYHPQNASLVALHRRLSASGVLRLGGNSSEFCWWRASPDAAPPQIEVAGQGRADNWMPQRFTPITPEAVDNLRGFLDACGWSCIWGLNFGTGSPERDAEEAAYVAQALGPRLLYFQIGNEPDLYKQPNNLLRPAGWDFPDYLDEWTKIADAVTATVPEAKFGGPDVGAASDWIVRFAEEAPKRLGARLVALSGHYYASGPPDAPYVTIANLLAPNSAVARRMSAIMPAARAANLAFRMTEGNSCYRGGKPGMSNALASALWGADYMLDMAAHGAKGINFHGGSGTQIANSLGDKLPGAKSDAEREYARLGTFYSPFAGSRELGFDARPLFYGMMLVEQLANAALIASSFDASGVNATAYAARAANGLRIALINKDAARNLTVRIDLAGIKAHRAKLWRLTGPALNATSGVRLAGCKVAHGGAAWRPRKTKILPVGHSSLALALPRASAALLFVE